MKARGDLRLPAIVATVLAVTYLGVMGRLLSEPEPNAGTRALPEPATAMAKTSAHAASEEVAVRFREAVLMLQAQRHEDAVLALHRVLEIAPHLPEAHVNLGFVELELGLTAAAARRFNTAISLRPRQANAYYGLAVALERRCDIAGAIVAMRTFVHLAEPDDPYQRKAEAALWEWGATVEDCGSTAMADHG